MQAIQIMPPKHVISCHYNCPAFFTKKYNPADEDRFKLEVEKMGIECHIMRIGDEIQIHD